MGDLADDPKVQQGPMALHLLCSLSQNLESLSHTSQDLLHSCGEKKKLLVAEVFCFFCFIILYLELLDPSPVPVTHSITLTPERAC